MTIEIKKLKEKDNQARVKALDTKHSYIIQAPAGSGKTQLLICRLLKVLSLVEQPNQVLAMTFTRKAAYEMRQRLIHALKQAKKDLKPTSEQESIMLNLAKKVLNQSHRHQWNLLTFPQQIPILTIDAFCRQLIHPCMHNEASTACVTLQPKYLYQLAAQQLLNTSNLSNSNDHLLALLNHLDGKVHVCEDLFVKLLAIRDQWLSYMLSFQKKTQHHPLQKSLEILFFDHLALIKKQCKPSLLDSMLNCLADIQHPILGKNTKQHLWQCNADNYNFWQAMVDLTRSKTKQWRKTLTIKQGFSKHHKKHKEMMQACIQEMEENPNIAILFEQLRYLPPPFLPEKDNDVLKHLSFLLPILVAHFELICQNQQQTDFIGISSKAQQMLKEAISFNASSFSHLFVSKQQSNIQHILIDEFQDTSVSQFDLLKQLTHDWQTGDGRSLMIVGDPMQSIYRFRQAQVELFIQAQRTGIGQLKLEPLYLLANFRSAPALVEWCNVLFDKLFCTKNLAQDQHITFHQAIAETTSSYASDTQVTMHCSHDNEIFKQEETCLKIIKKHIKQNPNQKITILARSRKQLMPLIQELTQHKIDFHAESWIPILDHPLIQHLTAITMALIDLSDRKHWIAWLTGPTIGLKLEDCEIIATMPSPIVLNNILDYQKANLSLDGKKRLENRLLAFKQIIEKKGELPIKEWIAFSWKLLQGSLLEKPFDQPFFNAFWQILEQQQHSQIAMNTENLLAALSQHQASLITEEKASVELMTIHQAKGLEFDAVILPYLEKEPQAEHQSLLNWTKTTCSNKHEHFIMAVGKDAYQNQNKLLNYVLQQEKIKSEQETKRLLYVACTRAKHQLHLIASKEKTVKKNSFLALIDPFIESLNQKNLYQHDHQASTTEKPMDKTIPSRIKTNAMKPVTLSHYQHAHHTQLETLTPLSYEKYLGIYIHQCLQQLSITNPHSWPNHLKHFTEQCFYQMKTHGLSQQQQQSMLEQCMKTLNQVIKDPKARWFLDNKHKNASSEYPIAYPKQSRLKTFMIDRSFIDEKILWIIDYKLSQKPKISMDLFYENMIFQHKQQLNLYAQCFETNHTGPIKLALYFPQFQGWTTWSFCKEKQKPCLVKNPMIE